MRYFKTNLSFLFLLVFAMGAMSCSDENNQYPVELFGPMAFTVQDKSYAELTSQELEIYNNTQLYNHGNKDQPSFIVMANKQDGYKTEKNVGTCKEYWTLKEQDWVWWGQSEKSVVLSSFFFESCEIIKFLMTAKPSQHSNFHEPYISKKVFDTFPVKAAETMTPAARPQCGKKASFRECINQFGHTQNDFTITDKGIFFEDEGTDYGLYIVAKGDYNHDGLEDMMLEYSDYAKQGTYHGGGRFCVTWIGDEKTMQHLRCTDLFDQEDRLDSEYVKNTNSEHDDKESD